MRFTVIMAGLAAAGLSAACGDPARPAPPCVSDRDCADGYVCGASGVCGRGEAPRVPVRGHTPEARDAGAPDHGRPDAGLAADGPNLVLPDAAPVDAGGTDARALDASAPDAGTPDAPDVGIADAAASDAGRGDGGAADAGPGSVPRGRYAYARVVVTGLSNGQGLWRVALSSNDRTLVAATRDGTLFVIDRATETLVREIALPRNGAGALRVGDVAFAPGARWLLVAATAYAGTHPTARAFRVEPRAGTVVEVGASPGIALERIVFRGAGGTADLAGSEDLGGGRHLLALFTYDDAGPTLTLDTLEPVAAGCQGLARAADGLGGTARVYTCGIGGGDIGHVDATGTAFRGPGVGNVSHVDARPSGDYALAVGWASSRLLRFASGTWTTGRSAPDLRSPRLTKLEFADDGARAIIVGAYDRHRRRAELREYRHGAYATSGLADISIPSFDRAPWLGVNGSGLFDAAWRPGCDAGYLVGGCGAPSCGRGWLIRFEVTNGRACPSP